MDAIFKALNDPARRALLDSLRQTDGQTLTDLCEQLDMTRFGVMKHLKMLEDARLIVTRKAGRFKYHYLNALPLQELVDRWVHPFLQPQARALSHLKATLEGQTMTRPDFILQTFIRCTQAALWEALTDADQMNAYHFIARDIRWDGDTLVMDAADGSPMFRTRTIRAEPMHRIEATFAPQWDDTAPSRSVFLIACEGDHCRLTLEHYGLHHPVATNGVADGWARWAAGLKTWLETGQSHRFAEETTAGAKNAPG